MYNKNESKIFSEQAPRHKDVWENGDELERILSRGLGWRSNFTL
jgi:hypothetical protein